MIHNDFNELDIWEITRTHPSNSGTLPVKSGLTRQPSSAQHIFRGGETKKWSQLPQGLHPPHQATISNNRDRLAFCVWCYLRISFSQHGLNANFGGLTPPRSALFFFAVLCVWFPGIVHFEGMCCQGEYILKREVSKVPTWVSSLEYFKQSSNSFCACTAPW